MPGMMLPGQTLRSTQKGSSCSRVIVIKTRTFRQMWKAIKLKQQKRHLPAAKADGIERILYTLKQYHRNRTPQPLRPGQRSLA